MLLAAALETMMSALRLLRENDPQRNEIDIDLDLEKDDAAVARALEQNQYVSRVRLHHAERNADWDALCRVLATRGNLGYVALLGIFSRNFPRVQVRRILQAIQQNSSVRAVLLGLNIPVEDLCSFLDGADHVADLSLDNLESTVGEQGSRNIAVALQRNTSIVTLKLLGINGFLDPILEGLITNTSVRYLAIDFSHHQVQRANALQALLESTRSIQHLELIETDFGETVSFHSVAQGLINGSPVTDITLDTCNFVGEEWVLPWNDLMGRKQNLRSLVIKDCEFSSRWPQFFRALCSALRRAASPLRRLVWENEIISNESLRTLCETVAVSNLESLSIHVLGRFHILQDAIPSMKIRHLEIVFVSDDPMERNHIKQRLREAVKQNFTLQSVKYRFRHLGYVVDDDQNVVKFYTERNTRLAQWVENPAITVPKNLWKEAVSLATKAGPETLYRLLRKIGPQVSPVGRKRKRNE